MGHCRDVPDTLPAVAHLVALPARSQLHGRSYGLALREICAQQWRAAYAASLIECQTARAIGRLAGCCSLFWLDCIKRLQQQLNHAVGFQRSKGNNFASSCNHNPSDWAGEDVVHDAEAFTPSLVRLLQRSQPFFVIV